MRELNADNRGCDFNMSSRKERIITSSWREKVGINQCSVCILYFSARPVHVSYFTCLQEFYACQLSILVSPAIVSMWLKSKDVWSRRFVLYRYVIVECEDQDTQQRDPKTHEMYLNVMRRFSQALLKVSARDGNMVYNLGSTARHQLSCCSSLQGDKSVRVMRSLLAAQQTFVDRLVYLMKAVQRESGNRKKKVS